MSDIVERLTSLADCDARSGEPLGKCMREAAETITSLRREVEEARGKIQTWHDARMATCVVGLQHPEYIERLNALAEAEHSLVRALQQPAQGDGG